MKTKQIAKEYNLNVINITKNNISKYAILYDISKKDLKNNAYVVGDEDIILGIYDDPELKMAAFFHEVGHTLVNEHFEKMVNHDQVLIEFQAWIEGLKVAKKHKYAFSQKAFKYILKSVNSYYKDALAVYNTQTLEKGHKEIKNTDSI